MRFALDIQSVMGQRTGVGMYTLNIAREMARAMEDAPGDELMMFYFDFLRKKGGAGLGGVRCAEYPVRVMPGRAYSALWRIGIAPAMDSLLPPADVFHFPNFTIPPMGSGRKVVTIHDLAYMRFPGTIEKQNLKFMRRRVPEALARADAVIAVSEFTRDELIELFGVDASRIEVIHEGVSAGFETVADEGRLDSVRRKYGLPDEFVLSVATLEPRKNIEGLLRAWRTVRNSPAGKGLKLVIAGKKGWGMDGFLESFEGSELGDSVLFTGYVGDEDLPALYSLAKVFVFVPLYEGFGLPVLEAFSCGCPVVCSKIPSLAEVCGEAAVMAGPNSPGEISLCITGLLEDAEARAELSEAGRARAGMFTWRSAAQKTLALYRKLCSR